MQPVPASLLDYLHGCPLCGATRLFHYARVPSLFDRGEFIRYERCSGCGVVLRNPRLPEGRRLEAYESAPLRPEQTLLDARNQVHYHHTLRWLRLLLPPRDGVRLLDFGCGAGGFLLEARAGGYRDLMGLELSRGLAQHVEQVHGFPVFQGLIDAPAFRDQHFDLIVANQVFEHLLDPGQTLAAVRAHLRSPGVLLIEVPNLRHLRECLVRGSTLDDSHLFYFDRHSLSRLLRAHGFAVARVEEGLRPYHLGGLRAVRRAPLWATSVLERLAAALGVRTGLSVYARLG